MFLKMLIFSVFMTLILPCIRLFINCIITCTLAVQNKQKHYFD